MKAYTCRWHHCQWQPECPFAGGSSGPDRAGSIGIPPGRRDCQWPQAGQQGAKTIAGPGFARDGRFSPGRGDGNRDWKPEGMFKFSCHSATASGRRAVRA
jgi:hypothetical protein